MDAHCPTCTCPPEPRNGGVVFRERAARLTAAHDRTTDDLIGQVLRGVDPDRGLDAAETTRNVHGTVSVTRAHVEVVRRRLEALTALGVIRRVVEPVMGGTGGSQPTRYALISDS